MNSVSVHLCHGCGIAKALDVAALEKLIEGHAGVIALRSSERLCEPWGKGAERERLEPKPDVLLVAACSARFRSRGFAPPEQRVERVDLRELVVWSHEPGHEDTQMLAEDCLRMGLAKASQMGRVGAAPETESRRILVVGGGPAGMAAALGAARAGFEVVLVEKDAALGGWLRSFGRLLPSTAPYRELEVVDLEQRVGEVLENPLIDVRTNAAVQSISGAPGAFDVTLLVGDECVHLTAGAIVQATGYKPYDAARLTHLGYGQCPDVVTSLEFERMLSTGALRRASDGRRPMRIALVQCAGSRDEAHLAHCSTVCCRVSLKHALWARELEPRCEVYVISKDVRAMGLHESFYRRAQEDPWIYFTTGQVSGITSTERGSIAIQLASSPLGEGASLEADLVVLATGMVPNAADNDALRRLADARSNVTKADAGLSAAQGTVLALDRHDGTGILGLGYRQGPDLPLDRYGFPNSHFICFPYETQRTGIYVAGCARAPNDIAASRLDAEGAVLKAILCVQHAANGSAVHPRWGDLAPPSFAIERCTQCKRCTEECPFGTLDEDVRATPKLNPSRCRRCGICVGACPERIIAFPEYSIGLVSSMIKSVEIPDEFTDKPRILLLACENDAYPALELSGFHQLKYSPFVRTIPVRCLGSINVVWIADALARGFDGVLLLGCKPGPDTQCHYIRGSELMATRSENVRQKLNQLALEDERVQIQYVSVADFAALPARIDAFVSRIEELGMNPFKDV